MDAPDVSVRCGRRRRPVRSLARGKRLTGPAPWRLLPVPSSPLLTWEFVRLLLAAPTGFEPVSPP